MVFVKPLPLSRLSIPVFPGLQEPAVMDSMLVRQLTEPTSAGTREDKLKRMLDADNINTLCEAMRIVEGSSITNYQVL